MKFGTKIDYYTPWGEGNRLHFFVKKRQIRGAQTMSLRFTVGIETVY